MTQSINIATSANLGTFFKDYETGNFYDELFQFRDQPRSNCLPLIKRLSHYSQAELLRRHQSAQQVLFRHGATFHVYGEAEAEERILPFDIIPRIISNQEWQYIEKGLTQRIHALNLLIHDIYHEQNIIKDEIIPREVIESSTGFLKECQG